jgi:hypothetical protein
MFTSSGFDFPTTGSMAVAIAPAILGNSRSLRFGVQVKALPTNTDPVYIVQPNQAIAFGYPLYPGESVELRVNDLASIYLAAVAGGNEVRYVAF